MSTGHWIDEAWVLIASDFGSFARDMEVGLTRAFAQVDPTVEKVGEGIERVFEEAARGSNQSLGDIGEPGTFTGLETTAERVGEQVEAVFEEVRRDADGALGDIGGAAFAPAVATAEVAAHQVAEAFEDAATDADRHLHGISAGVSGAIRGAIRKAFTPDPDRVSAFVHSFSTALATPVGLAVAAAVVTVAAPVITAAIGTAILAGAGGAVLGLAAIGLRESERIKKAFAVAGERVGGILERVAAPLEGPVVTAIDLLADAFVRLEAPLSRMVEALAPTIDPFVRGMVAFVEGAVPGLEAAMPGVAAAFEQIAANLPGLGRTVGEFFKVISENEEALRLTVDLLFDFLGGVILIGGAAIAGAQDALTLLRDQVNQVREAFETIRTLPARVGAWFKRISEQAAARWADIVAGALALPGQVWAALVRLRGRILDRADEAMDAFLGRVVGGWRSARDFIERIPASAAAALARLAGQLRRVAADALRAMWAAIRSGWAAARDWMTGIPASASRAIGNVRGLLAAKGRAVLLGFWDGLKSVWEDVKAWFGGIPSWIRSHKGPLDLDRRLLVGAGEAIMGGFLRGLRSGAGPALDFVKGIVGDIWGVLSGIGAGAATGGIQKLAQRMAAGLGWTGAQWNALRQLVQNESGWNPNAQNPTSSAYGLFQFLDSTWSSVGATKTSSPVGQIAAGLRYIASRYGNPVNALNFWLSHVPHWYDQGGMLPPGVTLAGGHLLVNATGLPERIQGRRVIPPARGMTINTQGAPLFAVHVHGSVDERVVPVIRRELNDAFAEFARLLRVGEVA